MKKTQYTEISDLQHIQYKEIINILFTECDFFKIVDHYDVFDINKNPLRESLINIQKTTKWGGPKISRKATVYTLRCDNFSKKIFMEKDSFFCRMDGFFLCSLFNEQLDLSFIKSNENNFKEEECIMYMISHEGTIHIMNNYYKKIIKNKA